MSAPEKVTVEAADLDGDRFDRLRRIGWWDHGKLTTARILVVGAGALGNEIVKNLALLGVEDIIIADKDRIENSNLSRSVLYREADIGLPKAEVAARAAREIYPRCRARALHADIIAGAGLGLFGWADIVIGGLDNREARLWINRCCWKMNRPWIDGAIEGINGLARVFLPGRPPCYECTLGEVDWAILDRRMSCNLLTREEMEGGKTPTTPTTSSVIAGIQVQEALKLLHGLPTLAGKAFIFEGMNHSSYVTSYVENPDCMSHETFPEVVGHPGSSASLTLSQLHRFACERIGGPATLDFSRDVIHSLECPACGKVEEIFRPVGSVSAAEGRCPADGQMRTVHVTHRFTGTESFGERPLRDLGLPPFDVFTARADDREIHILIAGDRDSVCGPAVSPQP